MSKRMIMVDYSPSVRQMVSFTLRDAGYEVMEAADARDAVAKLSDTAVHMVVADLNTPNLDGAGLIRELWESPAHRFVPVVMLTTESQESKKEEGKAAGATGWIEKPFSLDQLFAVVKKVLG